MRGVLEDVTGVSAVTRNKKHTRSREDGDVHDVSISAANTRTSARAARKVVRLRAFALYDASKESRGFTGRERAEEPARSWPSPPQLPILGAGGCKDKEVKKAAAGAQRG